MSRSALKLVLVVPLAAAFFFGRADAQQYIDQTSTRFPTQSEYTNQCSICDIDGDGDLDIALANGQGFSSAGAALKARIYVNNGAGIFTDESDVRLNVVTPPNPPSATAGWFRGVEFGDIDRDGDWDMILVQDFNRQPQLWLNNGLGFFSNVTATHLPAMTMSSARAQFGDVDNDGDLDLVFCNSGTVNRFGSGQPRLFRNDGTGHFTDATAATLPVGLVADQQDVIFGDIDNDYDLDIHLTSRASASKLWINNGAGVYTALAGFPGGSNAYSYDFGDMDGDGDLDLLGVNGGAEILLRNNHPTTAWSNVSSEISPNSAIDDNDSKFFDYDNDGDLDFIIGALGSAERVYTNNGSVVGADFTQITGIISTPVDSTMDIMVADLTGDGRLDIVTMQGESGAFQNRIYIGKDTLPGAAPIDTRPPNIVRVEQVPDSGNIAGPYVVRTVVYDSHTSDRGFHDKGIYLHWSVDGGPDQQMTMLWSGNSLWRGTIPGLPCGGTVAYHVVAFDFNSNMAASADQMFTITAPALMPGDLDGDGDVDDDDQAILVAVLIGEDLDPVHICRADLDGSGQPSGLDIEPFVAARLGP